MNINYYLTKMKLCFPKGIMNIIECTPADTQYFIQLWQGTNGAWE